MDCLASLHCNVSLFKSMPQLTNVIIVQLIFSNSVISFARLMGQLLEMLPYVPRWEREIEDQWSISCLPCGFRTMERLDVSRVARRLDGRDGGIIIGFVEMWCVGNVRER